MISFYCCFAGHSGKSCSKQLKSIFCAVCAEMIQHFQKYFFLGHSKKQGRHCADTVFPTAEWLDLEAEIPEIVFVCC